MSSPSGHSSLVMCDNFGQIILMLSAALLLYDFFYILFVSESQLYQVCKTEMKGMLLRRRKELISLNCSDRYMSVICLDNGQVCLLSVRTGMSVICLDRYVCYLLPVWTVCYLFGQVCLLSVWTMDRYVCYLFGQVCLLSVRTGMSVICSDRYVCYLFGQICLLSVTCLDSLLPVRTGCYLFGQVCLSSVTCSDSLLPVRTVCYLFGQAVICSEWKNATIFSSFELLTCVGCLLVSLP